LFVVKGIADYKAYLSNLKRKKERMLGETGKGKVRVATNYLPSQ